MNLITILHCDCPIDCQVIFNVKVQKCMKSIVRVVRLPSVVQSEFYNATRIIFVHKQNNLSPLCLSASPLLQRRLPYRLLRTTRGSHPLNINHFHSDSSFHHSSYLGLTDHPHLHLIYSHTYISHTHTQTPCEVFICPGCIF